MTETPAISHSNPNLTWLRIIAVLLLLLLGLEIYRTVDAVMLSQTRNARVQKIQTVISNQQQMIDEIISDYHAAAYDNPSVERIAEQQLLAAEHTLLTLQMMALQNNQIIQLLANNP